MKKQLTERQKSEFARRKAMCIALIIKPLKFIADRTNTLERDEKGVLRTVESVLSRQARIAASCGDGAGVQYLARIALAAG